MRRTLQRERAAARGTLDHELCLVDAAIALLADGSAARVTLTGLRFAERILATAAIPARLQGVVIRPIWRGDGAGCDIAVEPLV